ncbi:MAG: cation:proton antiporter [Chloroflexi bacterium]|nr:cation:proton antiporter [Chloroflexota bacterium]
MPAELTDPRWFVLAGVIFIAVALGGSVLKRLPITGAVLYLAIGAAVGPLGLGLVRLDPIADAGLIELLTELAVIVSLFTAGLKLRAPIRSPRWRRPIRLAFVSMPATVGLIAVAGSVGLGLPIGAAVLLGAVLAPTDPVLASDVQVEHPTDRDELRFSLTGEAGFNDGTAFPFVMLGLGLLGLNELGELGGRWVVVDLAWAVTGGLVVGTVLGTLIARVVLYLRRTHREAVGLDEFLCLGLIGLSYGVALLLGTYAFLAVFAAGLAVRRIERTTTDAGAAGDRLDDEAIRRPALGEDPDKVAVDEAGGAAFMASELLTFNERLERIGEVGVVVIIGALASTTPVPMELVWFAPLLFLVIRPIAVTVGLVGSGSSGPLLAMIAWFGIRGIGSLYYLSFAIVHGVSGDEGTRLVGLTLWIIVISIVFHGVSVTPIVRRYEAWRDGRVRRENE